MDVGEIDFWDDSLAADAMRAYLAAIDRGQPDAIGFDARRVLGVGQPTPAKVADVNVCKLISYTYDFE